MTSAPKGPGLRFDGVSTEPRYGTLLLALITGLLGAFLYWASVATIEETASGNGRVVPAQQLQIAQSLEGGIVRELLVRDGDTVAKDQLLLNIDDTSFASRLGELRQRRGALLAEVARLEAEAAGLDTLVFSGELRQTAGGAVRAEGEAFTARRQRLTGELDQLAQQVRQREQDLVEARAKRSKLTGELTPLRSELALNQRLAQSGNVARVDVLRLQRQLAELEGEAKVIAESIPRVEAAIAEARGRVDTATRTFRAGAQERLSGVRSDLAVIEETIKGASDKVTRTAVRSPVAGTINKLAVTSVGAVVQPGQPLAEIVPQDGSLLLEVRIRPKDIGFVRAGLPVSIKFTAYDYIIYGMLSGTVERISPDTFKDERGEPFFLAMVRTARNHLGPEDRKLPLMPGLLATADIQIGSRTVLDYLLKPVLRARHEALRER
jgi:membrane fusion protein, adhesin transport system